MRVYEWNEIKLAVWGFASMSFIAKSLIFVSYQFRFFFYFLSLIQVEYVENLIVVWELWVNLALAIVSIFSFTKINVTIFLELTASTRYTKKID